MSILSELGKILGNRHRELLTQIIKNNTKVIGLEQELFDLKNKVNELQTTGSIFTNDIIISYNKGVVLETEDSTLYRLKITSDKKLIVDNVTNGENHVGELILLPSGSNGYSIGSIDNDEET